MTTSVLARSLLVMLSCGAMSLVSGCAITEPAPAPTPVPSPAPVKVGGACSYFVHPGRFTATKVVGSTVHFAFHLPAGEPLTWAGQPDSAMNQNAARFEGDLVGQVSGAVPVAGESLPGFRQEEIHGTCTPWAYQVSIGGGTVPLEPAG